MPLPSPVRHTQLHQFLLYKCHTTFPEDHARALVQDLPTVVCTCSHLPDHYSCPAVCCV